MIYAATGHRPNKLGGYDDDVFNRLVVLANKFLTSHKVTKVISGMALGWDQAWAQAAFDLNIPVVAAVPFIGQERIWPVKSQDKFNDMLSKSESVKIVCPGGYAAWKMQTRNQWMVDNCDMLVALWDGSKGGTGNCVEYAKRMNKTIFNLWEKWK